MIRPIYDQKTRRDGKVSPELRRALAWWVAVLKCGLAERRSWNVTQSPPVHLFCDASGYPPHLGAVLLHDNECFVTHMEVPWQLLQQFKQRRDNQIMGLELLSISLGLCTFEHLIRDRNVIVHSDNTGSEVGLLLSVRAACFIMHIAAMSKASIRRGSAVSMDHAQLVHEQWTQVAEQGLSLYIQRVGTHDNIADLPSRDDIQLLESVGAQSIAPVLRNEYWDQQTWAVLQERWRL